MVAPMIAPMMVAAAVVAVGAPAAAASWGFLKLRPRRMPHGRLFPVADLPNDLQSVGVSAGL
jgi:hypothetical protein